jgi:hypothetical protein
LKCTEKSDINKNIYDEIKIIKTHIFLDYFSTRKKFQQDKLWFVTEKRKFD